MLVDILLQHLNDTKPKCSVGKWLLEQDQELQEVFALLVKKDKKNISSIWRDISSEDLPFKSTTFKSHMRGDCSCPKPNL